MEWAGLSENAAGIFGNYLTVGRGQLDKKMFHFILLQRFVYSLTGYDSVFCVFSPNNLKIKNNKCVEELWNHRILT